MTLPKTPGTAPLSGAAVKEITVPNCYSQAWRLGRTVLAARAAQQDPVQAVVAAENGRILFSGKIVDVTRKTAAGFVRGDLFLAEILATPSSLAYLSGRAGASPQIGGHSPHPTP